MRKKFRIILSIFLLFNQNLLVTLAETDLSTLPQIQTDNDTSWQIENPVSTWDINLLLSVDNPLDLQSFSTGETNSGTQNSDSSGNNILSWDTNFTWNSILSGNSNLSWNSNSGDSINSWILTTLPNLIISEVFFRWTDEWIEITNLSSNFSWNIILSWVKTSNLQISNISISSWATFLFWDTFTNIIDRSYIARENLSFSISDSKYMDIKLIYSGSILDSFTADTGTVDGISDYSSLEKIPPSNSISKTTSDRKYNVTSSRIANPGLYRALQTISTGDSHSSGAQNTWFLDTWNLVCIDSGATQILSISEVFPWNVDYWQYVELHTSQAINQHIVISGSAIVSPLDMDINLPSGGRILLTNDNLRFAWQNTQVLDTLTLSMSWWSITIYGQSGQVLDSVYISSFSNGKSLYYSNSDSCVRRFFSSKNFSPGMDDETFFRYMTTWENTTQIVYLGWWWGWCNCQTCPNSTQSSSTGSISSNLSNSSIENIIKISDIIYDPPGSDTDNEVVVLQSLSAQDIDLSKYRLQVEGQSSKKTIRWDILPANSTTSYKWNYQFPNSSNCILLSKDDQVLDKFCYSASSSSSGSFISPTNQIQNENKVSWYEIQITQIDFDPIGSDKENEKIWLKLLSDSISSLDLSNFKIQIQKDGKISNHSIQWILLSNTEQFIHTNSIFPNSTNDGQDVQVSLIQWDILFASYTYNPNKSEIQSGSASPYSWLNFQITFVLPNPDWNDIWNEKIWIKVSSISGSQYSGDVDLSDKFYLQIGQSKKKLSWYLHLDTENILTWNRTLPNKASCISLLHDKQILTTFCYEITKEGESVQSQNSVLSALSPEEFSILWWLKFTQIGWEICMTYKDQKINCKKLPSTKTARKDKQELKLYKNYMTTIQNYLKNQWPTFYSNTSLQDYFMALSQSKDAISAGKLIKNLGGESVSIFEADKQVSIGKKEGEFALRWWVVGFFGVE